MVGFREHDEACGSIKREEFLDQRRIWQLLKQNSAAWSKSVNSDLSVQVEAIFQGQRAEQLEPLPAGEYRAQLCLVQSLVSNASSSWDLCIMYVHLPAVAKHSITMELTTHGGHKVSNRSLFSSLTHLLDIPGNYFTSCLLSLLYRCASIWLPVSWSCWTQLAL